MFGFGIWELVIVLIIVVVIFSRRLPEIGESLGKGIRGFRKSIQQSDEIDVTPENGQEKEDKDKRDKESS
jgi:sec-independent protein translocase protein TatA